MESMQLELTIAIPRWLKLSTRMFVFWVGLKAMVGFPVDLLDKEIDRYGAFLTKHIVRSAKIVLVDVAV